MKWMTILAILMLGLLAPVGGQRQAPRDSPFEIVSGNGYEGAIIPAALVPDWFRERGVTSTWTPAAADVALAESRLLSYLRTAADGRPVTPPIIFAYDHPPYSLGELRELVDQLSKYKRQYLGLVYGVQQRRLLVNGLHDGAPHNWREQVALAVDGGCGYWHFDLDMRDQRIVRFSCQPSG
jgi:hypothetical protein